MNKLVKRGLILGIIGFVLGILIGLMFCLTGDEPGGLELTGETMFYLLIGGLQGMSAMGFTVVYEIEHWSILRCTVTHFIITAGGYFTMGYLQGWLIPGEMFAHIMIIAFVIAYFIIWLVQYLISLHKIRKMNEDLDKMKKD